MLDFEKGKAGWYSDLPVIADWRGTPQLDWSTNAPVAEFYGGGEFKTLRRAFVDDFETEMLSGDTLIIGIDYYAICPISMAFIIPSVLDYFYDSLLVGNVYYFKVYAKYNNKEIKEFWIPLKQYF